jgi:hypothetical protein
MNITQLIETLYFDILVYSLLKNEILVLQQKNNNNNNEKY